MRKWLKGTKWTPGASTIDTSKLAPLARIKIKELDEHCIFLYWLSANEIAFVTEESRDVSTTHTANIESIIDLDILKVRKVK